MPVAPPIMPYPGMIGGYGFNSWGGLKIGFSVNQNEFLCPPPPKMNFSARLTRRQLFWPLFLRKNRFLDPNIMKDMIFSKFMVFRATTASTQRHTHSSCFLKKRTLFFFGFFPVDKHAFSDRFKMLFRPI